MKKLLLFAVMASFVFAGYAKEKLTDEQKLQITYQKFVSGLTKEKREIHRDFEDVQQFIITDKAFTSEEESTLEEANKKFVKKLGKVDIQLYAIKEITKENDSTYTAVFEIVVNGKYKDPSTKEIKDSNVKNRVKINIPTNYRGINKRHIRGEQITSEVTPINYTTLERDSITNAAKKAIEKWYDDSNNALNLLGHRDANVDKCDVDTKNLIIGFDPETGKCTAVGDTIKFSNEFICDNPEDYVDELITRYELIPSFVVDTDGKLEVAVKDKREIAPKTNDQVIKEKALARSVADAYKTAIENNDAEALKQLFKDIEVKDGVQVSYITNKKEDIKKRQPKTYIKRVKLDRISVSVYDEIEYSEGKYFAYIKQVYTSKNYSDETVKRIVFDINGEEAKISNIEVVEGSTTKIE